MERLTKNEVTYTVEINDAGDVIYIPAGDLVFLSQYGKMLDEIKASSEGEAIDGTEETEALLDRLIAISQKMSAAIDGAFGDKTCEKATGCKIPSPDVLIELVNNITELIEKFTGERFSKIEKKYSNRAQRRAAKR